MLDTARSIETPEGIELRVHVAGPVPRALAWSIDALIRAALYAVLAMALSAFQQLGMGLFLILIFAMEWWYPVLFEVLNHGMTPGKRALGLCVLHDNGTPVTWAASLIRNLLRTVDFLPVFYGFGVAALLMSEDFKRLGDMAAGTRVVYIDRPAARVTLPEVQPLLPPQLQASERRAVLEFAERQKTLSTDRREELANIAADMLGARDAAAVRILDGYAAWLVGKRDTRGGSSETA